MEACPILTILKLNFPFFLRIFIFAKTCPVSFLETAAYRREAPTSGWCKKIVLTVRPLRVYIDRNQTMTIIVAVQLNTNDNFLSR
jgi:hypothetical protein